jgi:hypothetical protein
MVASERLGQANSVELWHVDWPDEPFGPCTEDEQYNREQLCDPAADQCDDDCWDWCNDPENPGYPWIECGVSVLECWDGSPCNADCECYFEYIPPK